MSETKKVEKKEDLSTTMDTEDLKTPTKEAETKSEEPIILGSATEGKSTPPLLATDSLEEKIETIIPEQETEELKDEAEEAISDEEMEENKGSKRPTTAFIIGLLIGAALTALFL